MASDVRCYAHTREGRPVHEWEPLEEHLDKVAGLAGCFAAAFDSGDWGRVAGLWHDLGKYRPAFQERLRNPGIRAEHAVVGACHAARTLPEVGLPLAFVITGHHGGLPNFEVAGDGRRTPLKTRVQAGMAFYEEIGGLAPPSIYEPPLPDLQEFLRLAPGEAPGKAKKRQAFWIRFLFSALVDADYLATESFMCPERMQERAVYPEIKVLGELLSAHIDRIAEKAEDTRVNRSRAEILACCRAAAHKPAGLFSLTVPTGGGKTLAGMDFALRHAVLHDLRRVIVVLPYTSIIEQNAQVYRDTLGAENVIEHHANLSPEQRREQLGDEITRQHERAEENWDAPVIVTTSVQFFESLFANATSRCRKLHNIARSVIILDEVQTLPPALLLPILHALNNLLDHYGCTVVLSTATPPALTQRDSLEHGLPEAAPIIPEPECLFRALSRVRYHWPTMDAQPPTWEEISFQLAEYKQVLVIVDRRADAYDLARELAQQTGEPVVHLSALMCPAHRKEVIERIKSALQAGETCRVVSTQLVEAGVDLDFPVVYRALAGLDRIVQAAGRCNREGKREWGEVYLFQPPKSPPPGEMRKALDQTRILLAEGVPDVESPEVFDRYFRGFYGQATDVKNILRECDGFNFETIARKFKLIEDANQVTVVCPWGDAAACVSVFRQAAEAEKLYRDHYRALQPYLVQIYTQQAYSLMSDGVTMEVAAGLYELSPGHTRRYDPEYGLCLGQAMADPAEFIT
jgi:CRISPR-associated endonuclease/helicase Cas3